MSKKGAKKFKEIAEGLPDLFEQRKVSYTGAALIEKGEKQVEGALVKPKRKYCRIEKFKINHENKLKAAFKLSGVAGVENYIKWVHEQNAIQKKGAKKPVNVI